MKPKYSKGIVNVRVPEIESVLPEDDVEFWALGIYFGETNSKPGDRETTFLATYVEMKAAEEKPSFKAKILRDNNISEDEFLKALADISVTVALSINNIPPEKVMSWPNPHLLFLPEKELAAFYSQFGVIDTDTEITFAPAEETLTDLEFQSPVWLDIVTTEGVKSELAAIFDNYERRDSFPKGHKVLTVDEMKLQLPISAKLSKRGEIVEIVPYELYKGLQTVLREAELVLLKQIRADAFGKWHEPRQKFEAGPQQ